jgi:NTE family protein
VDSSAKTTKVLVLQGGGALGAYQAGVFETLAENKFELDWVVGTSIGAINAAIIAGNTPENRVVKLKGFWQTVTTDGSLLWNVDRKVPTSEASFYDTSALEVTLNKFVDFRYLNEAHVRLTLSAVNVATAFAPVEVDGEFYWDGGIYSNTPLDIVLDEQGSGNTQCFMVDLWDATEALPTSISESMTRLKKIQYSSRSTERTEDHRHQLQLRKAIQQLGKALPDSVRKKADIQALLRFVCSAIRRG